MALPDLLPCPVTGDVILVPVGTIHARLTPAERRALAAALLAFDTTDLRGSTPS